MQRRDITNKNVSGQSLEYRDLPQTLEEVANATAREQQAINELKNIQRFRDPAKAIRRVPAQGKGYMLVPQPTGAHDQAALHLEYPHPQHIPAAGDIQPSHQPNAFLVTTLADDHAVVPRQPAFVVSLERVTLVACGIAIAVGALFVWIFRREVITYGGILVAMILVWKLAQWNTQISLYDEKRQLIQEGRLVPAQSASQHCVIHQTPPHLQRCQRAVIIPGGWDA
jgi:hypothetical protein